MNRRLRFAGAHLLLSAMVLAAAGALVLFVWYPAPLATVAGGLSLFAILVSVDAVLGPALTLLVASPNKPMSELKRDLLVIVTVQLAALSFGLYSIAQARPVFVVFELERLRVVSAAELSEAALSEAPAAFRTLSWTGPRFIAARRAGAAAEFKRSLEQVGEGTELALQTWRWTTIAAEGDVMWKSARSVADLLGRAPDAAEAVKRLSAQASVPSDGLRYLPLVGRSATFAALVAPPDARVIGYVPLKAP